MTSSENKTYIPIENTDHLKTEDILEIIDFIHNSGSSPNERKEKSKNIYVTFIERYPMLYLMACEDSYDKQSLKYMMDMRNRVFSDECSVESASRVIGNKFFGKFVSPVVDNLNSNKKAKHSE